MRRKPKQARSLRRVNHILDTAAQVFAEIGFEAATTNLIALRAEVSIGSLYQFFPNKESILEGLVERYLEEMQALNDALLAHEPNAHLTTPELIERFLHGLAQFEASHAGFRTIFLEDSQFSEATSTLHHAIVQRVDDLIAARFPQLEAAQRRMCAQVSIGIVKTLMNLTEPPDALPAERVLVEVKTALLAYIRAVLVREGHPVPDDFRLGDSES